MKKTSFLRMFLMSLAVLCLLALTACAHKPCACHEAAKPTTVAPETKPQDTPPQTPTAKDCPSANENGECALSPEELKELKGAATPKAP